MLSTSEQYLARNNGKKPGDLKAAMIFENDPFSLDVRAGIVEDLNKLGVEIIIDDKMPHNLNDIVPTLTKVRALKPDLLLISGHSQGAATAARQIKEMKIDVPMIAITHCEAAKIMRKFGKNTEGILCPTQWAETLSYKGKYFGTAANYDALFKKTYYGHKNVPYQSAQASAAVIVWKEAFEAANSLDNQKVCDAIAETRLQTFYGNIEFDDTGKNIAKPMVLCQIQNGKLNVVAPTKWASSKAVHPLVVP